MALIAAHLNAEIIVVVQCSIKYSSRISWGLCPRQNLSGDSPAMNKLSLRNERIISAGFSAGENFNSLSVLYVLESYLALFAVRYE